MGKLSDLWADLRVEADPDKRKEIQRKINSTEQWCIDKGFAGIKEITDWSKQKTKKTYRYEGVKDGGLNIPDGARLGKDKCKMCVYNNHSWCGQGMEDNGGKPCMGNV